MEGQLREALDSALSCIHHFIIKAPKCVLGADKDTSSECMAENAHLEFVHYRSVDMKTRECITVAGYAFREVVVQVANALDIPADCHTFHSNSVYLYRCAASSSVGKPNASHLQRVCICLLACVVLVQRQNLPLGSSALEHVK
jgi:hypothetical protein